MWRDINPDLEVGFARMPGGVRLRYRRMGGDGPIVLLLHGWPETGYAWRRIMPTLATSGYTAIAPDLRGSGNSERPNSGYDDSTRAADVHSLLESLELSDGPLFVVGHSDGGSQVAAAYAADFPDRVSGVALLGAAPGIAEDFSGWHRLLHQIPDLPEALIGPQIETYLHYFFEAWSHDPHMLPSGDLAVYVDHLSAPGALRAGFAPYRAEHHQGVGSDVPTLLLLGESDPRLDIEAIQTALRAWPHPVRLQTIPRAGHWLPEERPDAVAAALLTFFESLRSGS